MNLNVFDWPMRPRYYLKHPWKWFRELGINIRNAWWRITKGFAPIDCWNLNDWFLAIMPQMLRYLADNGMAYPGNDEFPDIESWYNFLYAMAGAFEECAEESIESQNEYHEEYFQTLCCSRRVKENENGEMTVTWDDEANNLMEISKLYHLRQKDLWEKRNKLLKETLDCFYKYFDMLWD